MGLLWQHSNCLWKEQQRFLYFLDGNHHPEEVGTKQLIQPFTPPSTPNDNFREPVCHLSVATLELDRPRSVNATSHPSTRKCPMRKDGFIICF